MAAAWTQKAGEGLAIVKLGGYESNRYWDNGSHRRRSPIYRKLELNPYVEYGVTDRSTVGANAFLLRVEQEGGGNNSGVSDVELFGRYRLHTDGWDSWSAQALLKIPAGYDKDEVIPLGAGQFDVEGRLLYGRGGVYESSGGQKSWYYDVEIAYRKRLGEPADEFRIDWLAGWRPCPAWTLEFKQENIFAASHDATTPGTLAGRWSDYDLHKATLGAIYQISRTLFGNAGLTHDLAGRNAGQGTAPFIAVWKRF